MGANVDAAEMIFSEGKEAEVTSDIEGLEGAWYTVTILKLPNKNNNDGKALVRYKNIIEDDSETPYTVSVPLSDIRPLPPRPRDPDDLFYQVKDVVDAFYLHGWWPGSISKVLYNPKRYIVTLANPTEDVEVSSYDMRRHLEWVDGKWVRSSKLKGTDPPKVEVVGEEKCCFFIRLLKFLVEGRQHATADETVKASIGVSEVPKMTNEAESYVSKELPIECMSGTKTKEESCHFIKEEINLQKEHDVSRYKKEDGAKTGINWIEQPNVVLEIEQPKLLPRNSQSPSAGKDDAAGVLEEKLEEEQTATETESSAISGLKQAEGTAVVSGTDCQRKIIKMAGDSSRILHETEEESPLICYKDHQPGVRESHSVVMDENNPGHGMSGDNERQEHQDLPFVKSLPMWKEVESMEIFRVMPQNPHFHPLVAFEEILREGLAVGHMLNFASMAQRTFKLTVADPRNLFTSILDALPNFEILGFDVKAIKDHTSNLLRLKDKYEQLQDHSKEVQQQVKRYSDEITKINEEVDANYKKMRELEVKQASLLSMKETKTSQITRLQVSLDVTTEYIQRVENDFNSLAGSPWYPVPWY